MSNQASKQRLPYQWGERARPASEAFSRGMAAAGELGLTAELSPVGQSGGPWLCVLRRDGRGIRRGKGLGKGTEEAAKSGALFEALEHHLSGRDSLRVDLLARRTAHGLAENEALGVDAAVSLLAEQSDAKLPCFIYRSLTSGAELAAPLFLSMPDYVNPDAVSLREEFGDHYDYTRVTRYSINNGWAAGTDPVEATVHALNEAIERDAWSLLLIEQFLGRHLRPLRLLDPLTLPESLAARLEFAQELTGKPVYVIDMTTDLGVPAYQACLMPEPGQASVVRGCGASLSRHYAIDRAINEMIQIHFAQHLASTHLARVGVEDPTIWPPALDSCRRSDFTPLLPGAVSIPYQDTHVPHSPEEHLERLLDILGRQGLTAYRHDHYISSNLAVVHVLVPGLERFMLVTAGSLVAPGPRGMNVRDRAE